MTPRLKYECSTILCLLVLLLSGTTHVQNEREGMTGHQLVSIRRNDEVGCLFYMVKLRLSIRNPVKRLCPLV